MIVIWASLFLGSVAVALLDLALIIEINRGLRNAKSKSHSISDFDRHHCVVLMPAHNEAVTFERAHLYLRTIAVGGRRFLVVADNCSDDTAVRALAFGAEVVERHDPNLRGKGYALDFGRQDLRRQPPLVVVVLDADCEMSDHDIDLLAMTAIKEQRPIQACNLLRPALSSSPAVQLSNFAFMIKNFIRQRGLVRLRASAIITGTGTAFPWSVFDQLELASGNIVEDLDMTVNLVKNNVLVGFSETAQVWSDCSQKEAMAMQRMRWEGGFLSTAIHRGPKLLCDGFVKAHWPSYWLAVHLLIPPLSLLLFLNVSLILIYALIYFCFNSIWFVIFGGLLVLLISFILILLSVAWVIEGYRHISFKALRGIPLYLMWKVALYVRLAVSTKPTAWIRTDRPS